MGNKWETTGKYLVFCKVREVSRRPECNFFVVLLREVLVSHPSSSFPSSQAERITALSSLILPL